jgi:hypothetical protein
MAGFLLENVVQNSAFVEVKGWGDGRHFSSQVVRLHRFWFMLFCGE